MGDSELQRGIETFRRQVELFSRGEYDAALEHHAPDVQIVTRDPDVAITGTWHGPEGHRELLAEWNAAWDGPPRYRIEEIIEVGDRFVAVANYRAVGAESGIEVEGQFVWLCEYRDGLLKRWETFTEREQALSAASGSA